jgi:hypothetical protein
LDPGGGNVATSNADADADADGAEAAARSGCWWARWPGALRNGDDAAEPPPTPALPGARDAPWGPLAPSSHKV